MESEVLELLADLQAAYARKLPPATLEAYRRELEDHSAVSGQFALRKLK